MTNKKISSIDPIFRALTGLYIAAKYNDTNGVIYWSNELDELDVTNYAQNICTFAASKDKIQGTNDSDIYKIINAAGSRLLGRSSLYESILIN